MHARAISVTERSKLLHRGLLLEYASLVWMAVESLGAIGAGLLSGSLALIAFGGDSFVELASSYTVTRYLRRIEKGENSEDERDRKVERITAFLLFALIPVVVFGALYSYLAGIEAEASTIGIAVALGAVVIMPLLWHEKTRIGVAASCLPLKIDAIESATCFLMSIALLAALAINYLWKIPWVDYVATAAILIFVAKEALESVSEMREAKEHATDRD
jgi:divalent metal cation (Fe/Co/Zn/Cd) transporter